MHDGKITIRTDHFKGKPDVDSTDTVSPPSERGAIRDLAEVHLELERPALHPILLTAASSDKSRWTREFCHRSPKNATIP